MSYYGPRPRRLTRRKAGVTMRALTQRINRRLRPDEALKATRGNGRARMDRGDFYVISYDHNFVAATHVDPESYARELGVLHAWERVVS
jgi:hypothetical protein